METWFLELVKQAPAAGAIIFVVVRFLAHLRAREERDEKAAERRDGVVAAALKEATEELGRTGAIHDRFDALHEDIRRWMEAERKGDHDRPAYGQQARPQPKQRPPG